jgi:undecaprenyl-diphosphatase
MIGFMDMLFRNWVKNLLFLLVYIFAGLALVIIIDGLLTGIELAPFNFALEQTMAHIRTPFLTNLMIITTNIGSPLSLSLIAIFISIVIVIYKDTYEAVLFATSIVLSLLSFTLIKNLIHLPRPSGSIITLSNWSFPSGHAVVATAFFFALAYAFFDRFKSSEWKTFLVTGSVFGAGIVCFSRLYLGAHYALDVLAGIALGLLSVSFTVLIFSIFLEERRPIRRKKAL